MVIEERPADISRFKPGHLLAGYWLETKIGEGGTAVVYRARDERLRRLVALKILSPELAGDSAFRRRFIGESDAIAAVDHPHIIPVYDRGEADGVLYISMRFVSGGDLRNLMRREGPLPPPRVAEIISPVASALDAAHSVQLVHRDVKPGNILIDTGRGRPDHVLLSDFGVSKSVATSVTLTGSGQFVGTAGYAAPEQIQELGVDGRADQYALACVAFELLTGEPLFQRYTIYGVLIAHVHDQPPSLTSRRPDLPVAANPVMAKALAKAPAERYPTCTSFAEALRAAFGLPPYYAADAAVPPAQGTPSTFVPVQGAPTALVPLPDPPTAEPPAPAPTTVVDGPAGSAPLQPATITIPALVLLPGVPGLAQGPAREAPRETAAAAPAEEAKEAAAAEDVRAPEEVTAAEEAAETGEAAEAADTPEAGAAPAEDVTGSEEAADAADAAEPGATESEEAPEAGDPAQAEDVTESEEAPAAEIVTEEPEAGQAGEAAGTAAEQRETGGFAPVLAWRIETPPEPAPAPTREDPPGAPREGSGYPGAPVDGAVAQASPRNWPRRLPVVAAAVVIIGGAVAIPFLLQSPAGTARPQGAATPSPTLTSSAPATRVSPAGTVPIRPTQLQLPASFTQQTDGYPGQISSVAVSPSGTTLAIAGINETCLWNVAHGGCTVTAAPAWAVAFSPDNKTLVGSDDPTKSFGNGIVRLSSTVTGRPVRSVPVVPGSAGALSVAFSPDGKTVAVGDQNGHAYLLDIATGQWTQLPNPAGGAVNAVAFNPSGTELAGGDMNGDTYLWNVATRQRIATLPGPAAQNGVEAVAFSRNGEWLATGDGNGNTYLWHARTRTLAGRLSDSGGKGVLAVAFDPDNKTLAVGDSDGTVYLWKLSDRTLAGTLPNPQGRGVTTLAFFRNGTNLLTGNYNGTVDSWPIG